MARILVVDDEPQVRTLLRRTLERVGHEVAEAGDGVAALEAYRRQPADLVILDIYMPEKEGLETLRELRAQGDVRIIAISGGGRSGDLLPLRVAQAFGAVRALIKPIASDVLLESVAAALAGETAGPA